MRFRPVFQPGGMQREGGFSAFLAKICAGIC